MSNVAHYSQRVAQTLVDCMVNCGSSSWGALWDPTDNFCRFSVPNSHKVHRGFSVGPDRESRNDTLLILSSKGG